MFFFWKKSPPSGNLAKPIFSHFAREGKLPFGERFPSGGNSFNRKKMLAVCGNIYFPHFPGNLKKFPFSWALLSKFAKYFLISVAHISTTLRPLSWSLEKRNFKALFYSCNRDDMMWTRYLYTPPKIMEWSEMKWKINGWMTWLKLQKEYKAKYKIIWSID